MKHEVFSTAFYLSFAKATIFEFKAFKRGIFSASVSNDEIILISQGGNFIPVIFRKRAIGKEKKNVVKYLSILNPAKISSVFKYPKVNGFSPFVWASMGKNLLPNAESGLIELGSMKRKTVSGKDVLLSSRSADLKSGK